MTHTRLLIAACCCALVEGRRRHKRSLCSRLGSLWRELRNVGPSRDVCRPDRRCFRGCGPGQKNDELDCSIPLLFFIDTVTLWLSREKGDAAAATCRGQAEVSKSGQRSTYPAQR